MSAELAAIASDPSLIERAADPGVFVIQACERGKVWLREALEHGDIEQIAELKSQAEAIRIYTISKNYSEDAKVSATELVRRAEGGIGRAVRKGQQDGWIGSQGAHDGNQYAPADQDQDGSLTVGKASNLASPYSYIAPGRTSTETYAMVDGVTEDDFEAVIAEAKAEGNLSRANVARKARARALGEPSPPSPSPHGDRGGRPPRGHASRRPLAKFAEETGWQLRKDIEKLERIFADDRFSYNRQQVATHLRGHLEYAVQVCQDLLDRISTSPNQYDTASANASQRDTTGD